MNTVRIGYAPTRRSIFSAPDARKYREIIANKLSDMGVEYVDIDDINEEGLLFDEDDRLKILEKFRAAQVDGLFLPHCNFGTEFMCARLAKDLDVPVLLWGPLDERPETDGTRLRDTQCGLFATGKVLRRFQVPFTYMTNCRVSDPVFERGLNDFLAVCNVVKTFRAARILQIGPRPYEFYSTMYNEGELIEKFNIEVVPVPLPELTRGVQEIKAENEGKGTSDIERQLAWIVNHFDRNCTTSQTETVAAMAVAMRRMLKKYHCTAGCIQCWNELQHELGIMPCAANSILNEEGMPICCEADVHGAITSLLIEAADMGRKRSFFADWTIRHPDDKNGELLQHCGPWPCSTLSEKPVITVPLAFKDNGALTAEAKHGAVTLARFDGDNGEYSLLLGNAQGIEGPKGRGTYLWVRVNNIKRLEAKIVEGPYIHHCSGIHDDVVPVLYEACKYLGIKPDLYDPIEEDVQAYLRGE
ncbi:L-fucose/L-arabinose isomerase family protein [Lancefieldella rimae]|uniref:L-fucose/L-arabinose isomerase family protein n=1 Tax=Lancefieldella rimae TaxID=1383 RepID=UPI001CAD25FF|nr:L-fucose/L-arabinose isomerase family protein [Lancefieldella rimae]MBF4803656.1 L-fucose/L-arabinose isomerase family protein [Lancefieldella rimae]